MCHASSANPSDTGRVKEEEEEEGEEEEHWGAGEAGTRESNHLKRGDLAIRGGARCIFVGFIVTFRPHIKRRG